MLQLHRRDARHAALLQLLQLLLVRKPLCGDPFLALGVLGVRAAVKRGERTRAAAREREARALGLSARARSRCASRFELRAELCALVRRVLAQLRGLVRRSFGSAAERERCSLGVGSVHDAQRVELGAHARDLGARGCHVNRRREHAVHVVFTTSSTCRRLQWPIGSGDSKPKNSILIII